MLFMGSFSWDSSGVVGNSFSRGLDGVLQNYSEFELSDGRGGGSGLCCSSSSLVLDNEKGELVRAPAALAAKLGQKVASEAKAKAALKSHSEAERRRRERINAHLNSLRSLIPCTEKINFVYHQMHSLKRALKLAKFSYNLFECIYGHEKFEGP